MAPKRKSPPPESTTTPAVGSSKRTRPNVRTGASTSSATPTQRQTSSRMTAADRERQKVLAGYRSVTPTGAGPDTISGSNSSNDSRRTVVLVPESSLSGEMGPSYTQQSAVLPFSPSLSTQNVGMEQRDRPPSQWSLHSGSAPVDVVSQTTQTSLQPRDSCLQVEQVVQSSSVPKIS